MQDPNKPAYLHRKVYLKGRWKFVVEDVSDFPNWTGKYMLFVREVDMGKNCVYYNCFSEDYFDVGFEDGGWEHD